MQSTNPNPNPTHIDPYSQYLYSQLHAPNPNPNPDPNPTHIDPYSQYLCSQLHAPNPNPNPNPNPISHQPVEFGYESLPTTLDFSYPTMLVPSTYYDSATGLTITPNGTQQLVPANPNSTFWSNQTTQPRKNAVWKKGPKKTKVVQSAWCEICKINCNSSDVLDKHKSGKKHMKNMEKLKEASAPKPAPSASATPVNPIIGPQENPTKPSSGQKANKKAAEVVEDLATKRRKLMEGGAAANAVQACAVCNVVCNSAAVFRSHLSGQKHAAMLKKLASGTGVAAAT